MIGEGECFHTHPVWSLVLMAQPDSILMGTPDTNEDKMGYGPNDWILKPRSTTLSPSQAKKIADRLGLSFYFGDGYWTLDPRVDGHHDRRLPLYFTASSLRAIGEARFRRYCTLALNSEEATL